MAELLLQDSQCFSPVTILQASSKFNQLQNSKFVTNLNPTFAARNPSLTGLIYLREYDDNKFTRGPKTPRRQIALELEASEVYYRSYFPNAILISTLLLNSSLITTTETSA